MKVHSSAAIAHRRSQLVVPAVVENRDSRNAARLATWTQSAAVSSHFCTSSLGARASERDRAFTFNICHDASNNSRWAGLCYAQAQPPSICHMIGPRMSSSPATATTFRSYSHCIRTYRENSLELVSLLPISAVQSLTSAVTGPFGAKLEAVSNEVNILPPSQTHTGPLAPSTVSVAIDPMTRCYILQPRLGEHSESIIIRHGDTIIFPKVKARLICQWTDSEVQVNSSATDAIHVPDSADVDAVAETPEEETEDEDLDNTITAAPLKPKTSQPRATPSLSNQRSVVIHETPTAARISGEVKYPGAGADGDASKYVDNSTEPVEDTPSSSTAHAFQNEPKAEAAPMAHSGESQDKPKRLSHASASPIIEAFASEMDRAAEARPSRHKKITSSPQVQILPNPTRKRATPVMEEGDLDSESEAVSRVSKRAKRGEDDTHDSRMSNIEVDVSPPRKTTAKGKKRQLEVAKTEAVTEAEDATPSRSQGSSQRSTAAISAEAYDDPTPRVAFSNSAITNTSHAVKFLKKHRGTYVENLTDGFNVLW
jgi:hypothetical protein